MILIPHCQKLAPLRQHTPLCGWSTHHLLGDHDNETGKSGAPHARYGEQLSESREVVGLAHDAGLDLQLTVDVVKVTGGLDLMVPET